LNFPFSDPIIVLLPLSSSFLFLSKRLNESLYVQLNITCDQTLNCFQLTRISCHGTWLALLMHLMMVVVVMMMIMMTLNDADNNDNECRNRIFLLSNV